MDTFAGGAGGMLTSSMSGVGNLSASSVQNFEESIPHNSEEEHEDDQT
jgi:hypothetical protein